MAQTRMIFAIQAPDPHPTRLRITSDVGAPHSVMATRRGGDRAQIPVHSNDGAWTIELAPGDHLVEIQVEKWLTGRLAVTAELASGQRPPIIVSYGPLTHRATSRPIVTWETTTLTVGDSKDPWPPPPPPPPSLTLASDSAEWFADQLATAQQQLDEAGGKGPPAEFADRATVIAP